ncbi:MAG TPA: LCP family protein [Bacillota bacterium]
MSLNPTLKDVRLLDIPRDTRAELPGHGVDKINAAYALGGAALAKASVSKLLGVPIDYYVKIDLTGAAKLIDILGGVDLTIDRPMDYDDPAQDLHIHLSPEPQHLDGEQAMGFVRWRSDGLGDIGRISRQQQFIKAIAAQVMTPAVLPRIPALIAKARKSVTTDIPLGLQVSMVMSGYNSYQNGLTTETLPGTAQYIDNLGYWVPDQGAIADLMAEWSNSAQARS